MDETLRQLLSEDKPGIAFWNINPDGYYPYCSKCGYEPPYVLNKDMRSPYCPKCGCRMMYEYPKELVTW